MRISATAIAKECRIARSTLYYLRESHMIDVDTDQDGRPVWDDRVRRQVQAYVESRGRQEEPEEEPVPYKVIHINNRRYLGNKYKLLEFIRRVVDQECSGIHTVADIFAGTGAVASAFTDRKLITNDLMYSNYICHVAWFGSEPYSEEKLIELILHYNQLEADEDNYMSLNFADTYFSRADCRKIGYIRENIEELRRSRRINDRERALLITSLLYAMDKIANTCGHYDAYRRGAPFEKSLELAVPQPEPQSALNPNNCCYREDTNQLMDRIEADLVYMDPPYNSRQYCDAYHLLENVARWEKPQVHGVARKMDRTELKSDYCTAKAEEAFEDLVRRTRARYILLSYNNMAGKGNDRSNAKIRDEEIMRILKEKGDVTVFSERYKAFTTGKSDIQEHEERLFLCVCRDTNKPLVPSPLNYTGGKFKLLPQLLPLFPKDPDQVVDLFCGGCNVGINAGSSRVIFNDSNPHLIRMFRTFARMPKEAVFEEIGKVIRRYGLSRSSEMGYDFYHCESSKGLGDYNRKPYMKLREDFNSRLKKDGRYDIMLYVLMVYSFNNQIRFNRKGEFNLPVGKRDFNPKMQRKLDQFLDRLKSGDYVFLNQDFESLDPALAGPGGQAFYYADPPYLITCATYNEQSGWGEEEECRLLGFLDRLHRNRQLFALSNVLESKGRRNHILDAWIREHREEYRVIDLDFNYDHSNYQIKDKNRSTREVLVVNYPEELQCQRT